MRQKRKQKRELLRLLVACLVCRWQSSLLRSERFFPVHIESLFYFREEQYRQVWTELEHFLEAASKTSKMHEKVKFFTHKKVSINFNITLI